MCLNDMDCKTVMHNRIVLEVKWLKNLDEKKISVYSHIYNI